jgi:hypothetical protein
MSGYHGRHYRVIGASISVDGKTWSDPKIILTPELTDPLGTEFYQLAPFFHRGNLYGILNTYQNTPNRKTLELQLVVAKDPNKPLGEWIRCLSNKPILRPSYSDTWDGSRVYTSSSVVLQESRIETSPHIDLYYGGANTTHDDRRYWRASIGLARALYGKFGGVIAGYNEGEFETVVFDQPVRQIHIDCTIFESLGFVGVKVVCLSTGMTTEKTVYRDSCKHDYSINLEKHLPRWKALFKLRRASVHAMTIV